MMCHHKMADLVAPRVKVAVGENKNAQGSGFSSSEDKGEGVE